MQRPWPFYQFFLSTDYQRLQLDHLGGMVYCVKPTHATAKGVCILGNLSPGSFLWPSPSLFECRR